MCIFYNILVINKISAIFNSRFKKPYPCSPGLRCFAYYGFMDICSPGPHVICIFTVASLYHMWSTQKTKSKHGIITSNYYLTVVTYSDQLFKNYDYAHCNMCDSLNYSTASEHHF